MFVRSSTSILGSKIFINCGSSIRGARLQCRLVLLLFFFKPYASRQRQIILAMFSSLFYGASRYPVRVSGPAVSVHCPLYFRTLPCLPAARRISFWRWTSAREDCQLPVHPLPLQYWFLLLLFYPLLLLQAAHSPRAMLQGGILSVTASYLPSLETGSPRPRQLLFYRQACSSIPLPQTSRSASRLPLCGQRAV